MKEDRDEQDFLVQARKILDSGSENLDASVRSRLIQRRMIAVEQGKRKVDRRWLLAGVPIVACLAMTLVVFSLFFRGGFGGNSQSGEGIADLEIITATETPDFYADLEFYQWLAEENRRVGG